MSFEEAITFALTLANPAASGPPQGAALAGLARPPVLDEEHPALAEGLRGARAGEVLQERGDDRAHRRGGASASRTRSGRRRGATARARTRRSAPPRRPGPRSRRLERTGSRPARHGRDREVARCGLGQAAVERGPCPLGQRAPARKRGSTKRSTPVPARRSAIASPLAGVGTPAADHVRIVPAAIPRAAARDTPEAHAGCPRSRPARRRRGRGPRAPAHGGARRP